MKEVTGAETPRVNPSIERCLNLGDIGLVVVYPDGPTDEALKRAIQETLAPLNRTIHFYDWHGLEDRPTPSGISLRDKFTSGGRTHHSLYSPQYTFLNNSINVFYNCKYLDVEGDSEEVAEKNAALTHLLDFFAGGTGFAEWIGEIPYDQLNAKVVILISENDFFKIYIGRGFTQRSPGALPWVPFYRTSFS